MCPSGRLWAAANNSDDDDDDDDDDLSKGIKVVVGVLLFPMLLGSSHHFSVRKAAKQN